MFVFSPPPPRLSTAPYAAGGTPGQTQFSPETYNNTISNPEGPDYCFSVGEGTYTLREDLFLAVPPPHPSEVPVVNPNPLATNPTPVTAGTKLSLAKLKYRPLQSHHHRNITTSIAKGDGGESRTSGDTEGLDDDGSETGMAGSGSGGSRNGGDGVSKPLGKFGGGNAALCASMKDGTKRKRQKNNISKSNSSFISGIITHPNFAETLAKRNWEDLTVFANINRAFHWLDMTSSSKHQPLSKILFTKSHPLCHDVNILTKSSTNLDVIIGFSSGDIMWFDPISNRYARINKNGQINSHPVMDIKWIPGSESLFLAAHMDGSLVVYDKDKDDTHFVPEGASSENFTGFSIRKSVESKHQKANPIAYWRISKQPINAFAFSSDCIHLAAVSEDGCLRIIDYVKEKLLDTYNGYYGGLLCVCWSPDGRYILTGGQDDLVSIWSFTDRKIIARCQGHQSWVTGVAFDPWRCDERTYRFGSVGEDCRLLLWDFSVGMLHRPKATSPHRGSMSSNQGTNYPTVADRLKSEYQRLRSETSLAVTFQDENVNHPVEARSRTPILPPIMMKEADPDPLTSLIFQADSIIVTCKNGHIRTWDRPSITNSQISLSIRS